MDSDDFRFWLIILGAIGVAFAAVIGSTFTVCHHIERMVELGYEEEPVPGSNRLMWRRRTPPRVEPKLDLTPVQPIAPKDIIESLTNDVPRGIIDYITTHDQRAAEPVRSRVGDAGAAQRVDEHPSDGRVPPVRAGAQLVGAAPLLRRRGHEPHVGGEVMCGTVKAF